MLAKLRARKDEPLLPKDDAALKMGSGSKLSSLAKSKGAGLSGLLLAKSSRSGLSGLSLPTTDTLKKPLLVRKSNLAEVARQKAAMKRRETPEHQAVAPMIKSNLPTEAAECPASSGKRKNEDTVDSLDILFDLSVASSLLRVPGNIVSVFLFEPSLEPPQNYHNYSIKRRQLAPEIFHAYTNRHPNIAKAKANFNLPSPDDKVLEAQKQAFAQDLGKLSISEQTQPDQKEKKIPTATKPFKSINIAKELSDNPIFTKPNKSFVIIGHVDAGKSTLMGRILYDSGTVDAKTVNKLVREAEKSGKGSFAFAWIMDQTSEERSRGVTIDICATTFETPSTKFTAIDAPGHKDFVPQMIGGVSQADMALLVIDSINGEFEAGFFMDGQTKEHTLLAKNLGIDKMCVAVNKMDKEHWSEARFEDIKAQLLQFFTSDDMGFLPENISFVPISGLTGVNVVKNDHSIAELAWYEGPTLVECLESIKMPGLGTSTLEELEHADFNLSINDIYDVTGSEFKVRGKITLGMIQPGQTVVFQPSEDYLQIQALFLNDKLVDVAIRGQIVSAAFKINQLKNKSTDDLSIGDIVLDIGSKLYTSRSLEATVNMFNMDKPLLVGTPFVLFRNNASIAARISKIIRINGAKKKKMHLVSKQSADVVIEILGDRLMPVTKFADNKALGRIVIRREGSTVGAGVVTAIQDT